MSDRLSVIADRYPSLGQVLDPYVRRLRTLGADVVAASWLGKAAQRVADAANPWIDDYLAEWNEIAALLDQGSREELSERFLRRLPKKVQGWLEEYADQFLEVCSELLGYGWLRREKNCAVVTFVKEGPSPEPDLLGDRAVVVECKHFRTSQKDRGYFARHQGEAWPVTGDSPDRLLTKVLSTFDNSVLPKFTAYPSDRFERYMFGDFSFDVELWGPIESTSPGTIGDLIEGVRTHLAGRAVNLAAIRSHSLRQQLTIDQFQTPAESLQ